MGRVVKDLRHQQCRLINRWHCHRRKTKRAESSSSRSSIVTTSSHQACLLNLLEQQELRALLLKSECLNIAPVIGSAYSHAAGCPPANNNSDAET
jgi:hypothetical protein